VQTTIALTPIPQIGAICVDWEDSAGMNGFCSNEFLKAQGMSSRRRSGSIKEKERWIPTFARHGWQKCWQCRPVNVPNYTVIPDIHVGQSNCQYAGMTH
jgi:hypothetical protein